MIEPTKRQLDALAAWWKAGGSNVEAAKLMDLSPQIVRNTLMFFRRQENAQTNLLLALRYREQIERRRILKAKHRKAA
jgi:hypothetical protein